MSNRCAKLSFHNHKHCFMSLPRSWTSQLSRETLHTLEIRSGDQLVYVSWAGDLVQQKNGEIFSVELNGLYGDKLGLKHDQEILVSPIDGVSCKQICVEPLSIDDWEILELHAEYIQSHILDQVRVVWAGQILPLWVDKAICIFVSVTKTVPSLKCAILDQMTEVIVAPKIRHQGAAPNHIKDHNRRSNAQTNHVGKAQPSIANITESITELSDQDVKSQSQVKGHSDHVQGGLKISKDSNGVSTALTNAEKQLTDNLKTKESNPIPSPYSQQIASMIYEKLANLAMLLLHGPTNGDVSSDNVEPTVEEKCTHLTFDSILRVQELDERVLDTMEHTPYTRLLLQQTAVVFISAKTVFKHAQCQRSDIPKFFIAQVKKFRSPKDAIVMKKEQEKIARNKAKDEKTADKFSVKSDTKEMKREWWYVTVIVTDHNTFVPISKSSLIIDSDSNHNVLPAVSVNHVIMSDSLRRQLHVGLCSKINIKAVASFPSNTTPSITYVDLLPLFILPEQLTHEMIKTAFNLWLSESCQLDEPCLLQDGMLIRLMLEQDKYGEFILKTRGDIEQYFVATTYSDIHVTVVTDTHTLQAVVSLADIDPVLHNIRLRHLGGVSMYAKEAMQFIDCALAQRPLAQSVFNTGSHGIHSGGLLITGPRGCGKSSLARVLCRELVEHPNLCHVTVVDCKSLRGKKIESLTDILQPKFDESSWCQPAVVLLDDLDFLASACTSPEQEMTGEANHFLRVTHALRDIVIKRSNVVVIATSASKQSLNPVLVSRGCHFFHCVVDIKIPNKDQRKEILLSQMHSTDPTTSGNIDFNWLISKTEGYVARDLEKIVLKAIHAHHMVTPKDINVDLPLLTTSDFKAALDRFTPISLRNVPLHKSGELGWHDVGGLNAVKDTLIQTLELPAKYPDLFASCPLRLQRGILLYGAPGTGKTLIAGVVAKECGLNFISIKGPELLSKYIGASELAVRQTFHRAQSAKPCVLFFDEFDSLAPRRGHDSTGVTDRVVNQLLTQLDGVEELDGVYVLAATSRPDLIDPALLRPGRLDKCLSCPLPDESERLGILQAQTLSMTLNDDVDLLTIANMCQYFTGADLKALLYNAQLEAIHEKFPSTNSESCTAMDAGPVVLATVPNVDGSDKGTVETEKNVIIYMPTLEEGSIDITDEHRSTIMEQTKIHGHGDFAEEKSKDVARTTIVNQSHLLKACREMRPSVSAAERAKYDRIYSHFVSSKKGSFSAQQQSGQRLTLA